MQQNVGDRVWYASHTNTEIEKPCIVCYGEKQVTVILGNRDKVVIDCDFCGHGLDKPTGIMKTYEWVSKAELITITKVEVEIKLTGEERQYFSGNWRLDIDNMFDTEAKALVRSGELAEAHHVEEETQAYRLKAHKMESYAWNVGYHLRQAKQNRDRAEYHEQKAVSCKARIRRGGTE